jgi:hypothetical protein
MRRAGEFSGHVSALATLQIFDENEAGFTPKILCHFVPFLCRGAFENFWDSVS